MELDEEEADDVLGAEGVRVGVAVVKLGGGAAKLAVIPLRIPP